MPAKQEQPTEKEWKRLYELSAELKKLAPWEWMDETEIFGVENPDTKEIGFVSSMGIPGEHFSVSVFLGAEGLYGFWDFQIEGDEADPLALFEIPQIQVSFENREVLQKQDRDTIKKLGLKFRGAQNYPVFRSIRPGFAPWFITSDEARMFIYAIEQTLEVAPRVRENPDILDDDTDTENEVCLVRVADKRGKNFVWHDELREIPPPDEIEFIVRIPPNLVTELKDLPQAKNFILEMGLFYVPNPVVEKGKRPFFPKILMLADARSGIILNVQLIQPESSDAENYTEICSHVLASLQKLEARPQEIRVADDLLFDLFKGLNQQVNIKLRQTDDLRAIEAAKDELSGFLGDPLF